MKVLLYEQPFGQSLSAIHAYELWEHMRQLGVEATYLTEPPQLPETVARVTPRLAGEPPRLRWTNPRSVFRYTNFKAKKLQPLRSLLTLYSVWNAEQGLLRKAQPYQADLVYRRHNYLNTEVGYAHGRGIPVITEVNGIIQDEAKLNWWSTWLSNQIVARWENSHFGQADHYIVVSEHLKEVLAERFGVPESKITVILNGVNTGRFFQCGMQWAKNSLGLNPHQSYVVFAGSLSPWQGVEYLVRAMSLVREKYPSAVLLVIGSGIEHTRLEALAASICPSTQFLGQVPHAKVPTYLGASAVCVLPRVKSYNDDIGVSPLKLCEYLSCSRPVVASNIRGLECLEQNRCGLLVPAESPKALAGAICQLLGDRSLAAQMGQNGRAYVLANRSWKIAAEKTLAVCQKVKEEYR